MTQLMLYAVAWLKASGSKNISEFVMSLKEGCVFLPIMYN